MGYFKLNKLSTGGSESKRCFTRKGGQDMQSRPPKKTFGELVRGVLQHMTSPTKNSVTVTHKRRDCDWDMLRKLEQISESKTHTQF